MTTADQFPMTTADQFRRRVVLLSPIVLVVFGYVVARMMGAIFGISEWTPTTSTRLR
jgi:hypothetical protein